MKRAFFFDRDGVVNHRIIGAYVRNIEEFEFKDGFFELFEFVKSNGFLAVLVTNQQGIGKGLMTESDLQNVHDYMQTRLNEKTGFEFDALYFCPSLASANSPDRKPNYGMFAKAIEALDIQPDESWTIGDSPSDMIAGKGAGTRTIFLDEKKTHKINEADFTFDSLNAILAFLKNNIN